MTSLNHSAAGSIVAYLIYPNWIFIATAFILSWSPDIEIWYQTITKKERDYTKFYLFAHYSYWVLLIPFMNLHFLMDKLVHKKEGGMNDLYYPIEILSWVTYIVIILSVVV